VIHERRVYFLPSNPKHQIQGKSKFLNLNHRLPKSSKKSRQNNKYADNIDETFDMNATMMSLPLKGVNEKLYVPKSINDIPEMKTHSIVNSR
jgi:hypothetical protein